MGLNFEFATATQIIFGCGTLKRIPGLLKDKGKRILLVTGKDSRRSEPLAQLLLDNGFAVFHYSVGIEPTTTLVTEGAGFSRSHNCDAVVGIGGGSVIDAAKAIAALHRNEGNLFDYLEVIGKGRSLENHPLPYIAAPTTAGTGAEVTKNAVILSPEHQVKVSLRSAFMFPYAAVTDPELTLSMPPEVTAATGMDALTHLLETFVSCQSNPFIDIFCREGMKRISRSLKEAFINGENISAREDMAMASMLGGLALANVKLGAVHGFAGPMGGMFPAPHGAVCAALLPAVMKVNLREVRQKNISSALVKYREVAQILTGNPDADAEDGIRWVNSMTNQLGIPNLASFGLLPEHYTQLAAKAGASSSIKGNPVSLNDNQLMEILLDS